MFKPIAVSGDVHRAFLAAVSNIKQQDTFGGNLKVTHSSVVSFCLFILEKWKANGVQGVDISRFVTEQKRDYWPKRKRWSIHDKIRANHELKDLLGRWPNDDEVIEWLEENPPPRDTRDRFDSKHPGAGYPRTPRVEHIQQAQEGAQDGDTSTISPQDIPGDQ